MAIGRIDDEQFQAWADRVIGKTDQELVKKELTRSVKKIGQQAIKNFKNVTPEDTGHLRRSWRVQDAGFDGRGWVIELTNNTKYASWVDKGHRLVRNKKTIGWVEGKKFVDEGLKTTKNQLPELITPGLWAFRDLLS